MSKPDVTDEDWELIRRIIMAFRGVQLEDGVGLREAEGMDNYASPERLAKLRSNDEKQNWELIRSDALNDCSSALSYFDPRGMRFHLPAYMIAELMYELEVDLMLHLTNLSETCLDRFSLLNEQQRATVRDFLELCLVDSDDVFGRDLQAALNNYWRSPVHKLHRD